MVRSPVTRKSLSERASTAVERKVMSGNVGASRKSLVRRCWSRCSTPVSMLSALITTWPEERDGSAPSRWAVPSNWWNAPRTLVTMAWRATKPIRVWVGSRT